MGAKIRVTYNFAPSFCFFVPNYAAYMLKKNYSKDTFDLSELNLHNSPGIEHDASLTRRFHLNAYMTSQICMMTLIYIFTGQDTFIEPNQAKPHIPFVEELLASATGKDKRGNLLLTSKDLAAYSSKRRVDAHKSNPVHYKLDLFHKLFGSSK